MYEMMYGLPPFYNKHWNRIQLYSAILNSEVKFPQVNGISDAAKDFISKLLNKDKAKRLGSKNI